MIVTTTNRVQPPTGPVLHVAGELDSFSAERLREHLRQLGAASDDAVVVDLSGVTFMSCTALAVLAEARGRLGVRLFVGGRSRVVARLLRMTGLSAFFADVPDRPADGARSTARAGMVEQRAHGVLMALHGCTAEEAATMLADAAEDFDVPVAELVALLIRAPRERGRAPCPAAAAATLALLMRAPAERAGDEGADDDHQASTVEGEPSITSLMRD